MPIYEYRCRDCGAEFEVLQKLSDPPVAACEKCSGPVDKLVSQTAFQLKGTGWYVTDYARKPPPGNGKGKESSEKKGDKDAGARAGGSGGEASSGGSDKDGGSSRSEGSSKDAASGSSDRSSSSDRAGSERGEGASARDTASARSGAPAPSSAAPASPSPAKKD